MTFLFLVWVPWFFFGIMLYATYFYHLWRMFDDEATFGSVLVSIAAAIVFLAAWPLIMVLIIAGRVVKQSDQDRVPKPLAIDREAD